MSRKWERMVERNRKSVNKVRTKQGQPTLLEGGKEKGTVIKGRSWMLPSVLVIFAVFYFISTYKITETNGTYWFTGISYILLAVLIFLVRRPTIKISRAYLTVRRYTGDKFVEPKDIDELVLNKGHVVIQLKEKQKKLIYTKLQHQFPMELLNEKLKEFAVMHKIPYKDETR